MDRWQGSKNDACALEIGYLKDKSGVNPERRNERPEQRKNEACGSTWGRIFTKYNTVSCQTTKQNNL